MNNVNLMKEYIRLLEAGESEPWKHFERIDQRNKNSQWATMVKWDWFVQDGFKYRLKPKTININGIEVPEPEKNKLDIGDCYYIPFLYSDETTVKYYWVDNEFDNTLLGNRLVHLTKEAAEIHSKALLSFTRNFK